MSEKVGVLWGTDSTVSQQYLNTLRRSEHFEPEKALLRAILEDAVHCYRKYQLAQNRAGRERFREVERWIIGSSNDWIFSFDNVCQLLGLDPMYVLRRLRERNAYPATQPKPRPRRRAA